MRRKGSKTKQKQKQKQSQKVIVNINQSSRRGGGSKKTTEKSMTPLMPSFNINQPTPSPLPDLTKLLGFLSPILQTHSRLGNAVSTTVLPPARGIETPTEPVNVGGLVNPKETPSFEQAIENKVKELTPVKEEPLIKATPIKEEEPVYPPTEKLFASAAAAEEEQPMQQPRKYEKRKNEPRRNSMLDLEQRYTNITGMVYAGKKMKAKDFRDLVEKLESKAN